MKTRGPILPEVNVTRTTGETTTGEVKATKITDLMMTEIEDVKMTDAIDGGDKIFSFTPSQSVISVKNVI